MTTTTRSFAVYSITVLLFATILSPTQAQTFLTNGLVAHYGLNGNANDASGNANNGTISNIVFVSDRFGVSNSAGLFAGNSGSFITLNTTNINLSPPFSVSAWIRFTNA